MSVRQVTWGDALVVEAFKARGGLKIAVDRILKEMGPAYGSRNTYAKLFKADGPASLSDKEKQRAWLLLTAFGQQPDDWGINTDEMPNAWDVKSLRATLAFGVNSHRSCVPVLLRAA